MIRWFMIWIVFGYSAAAFAMGNLPSGVNENGFIGKPAAEFTLETTSSVSKSLTQARAGKRAIMFFWATWCPHCHEELEKIRHDLGAVQQKGIQMLLVDVGETKEDVKAYLAHQGIALESFVDEDNTVAGQYSVIGVPTLFFLDEQGIVRSIEHEFPTDYEDRFTSQ